MILRERLACLDEAADVVGIVLFGYFDHGFVAPHVAHEQAARVAGGDVYKRQ